MGGLTFIHICADSSLTVLEYNKAFIPLTLESLLEEGKNPGNHRESNPGPPTLAPGAPTTERQFPTATQASLLQVLR